MNRISYAAVAMSGLALVLAVIALATGGGGRDGAAGELAALRDTAARLEAQLADTADSVRTLEASVTKTAAETGRALALVRGKLDAGREPDPARLREVVGKVLAERTERGGARRGHEEPRAPEKPKAPPKPSWRRDDITAESLKLKLELEGEKATKLAAVYRERAEKIGRVSRESREKGLFGHAAMQHVWKVVEESDAKFAELLTPEQLEEFRKLRGRDHPRGRDFHQHRARGHKARPADEKPPAEPEAEQAVF